MEKTETKEKSIGEMIDEAKSRNGGKISDEDAIQIGIEICKRADEVTD